MDGANWSSIRVRRICPKKALIDKHYKHLEFPFFTQNLHTVRTRTYIKLYSSTRRLCASAHKNLAFRSYTGSTSCERGRDRRAGARALQTARRRADADGGLAFPRLFCRPPHSGLRAPTVAPFVPSSDRSFVRSFIATPQK